MRHGSKVVAAWIAALGIVACAARGAVETLTASASIRQSPVSIQGAVMTTDFSVLAWVWRSSDSPGAVLQFPGVFELAIESNAVSATVRRASASGPLTARVNADLPLDAWTLVGLSFDRISGALTVHAGSEATGAIETTSTSSEYALSVLGPGAGDLAMGASPAGMPGIVGTYGLVAIRNHRITSTDFLTVWTWRRYLGAHLIDTTPQGGLLTGPTGTLWMVNHAMSTLPIDGGAGGEGPEKAAIVGQPATTLNFVTHLRNDSFEAVTRPLTACEGFTYVSHRFGATDGFFNVDRPGTDTPLDPVPAAAPLARQLAHGPTQLLRVMVSANSRAARTDDGSGVSAGNYAQGFLDVLRPNVAGVMLRPAIADWSGKAQPWFGLDASAEPPMMSDPGSVRRLNAAQDAWGSFSRLWSGSSMTSSIGPGNVLLIKPDGYFGLRCKPEPGSLLLPTEPLTVQAHVLRFPGSSTAIWDANRGPSQSSGYTGGGMGTEDLDTTTYTHTMGGIDVFANGKNFWLTGDLRPFAVPGDALFVSSGAGAGSLGFIKTMVYDGNRTFLLLHEDLAGVPAEGSVLHLGPWSYDTISFDWPALLAGDPNNWRGLRVRSDDDGVGVILFGFSAWRTNATRGFIVGSAGWAGHGYQEQLDEAWEINTVPWMKETHADVWIQAPAQQRSQPPVMAAYTGFIRQALPDADIVWAGEMEHEISTFEKWHEYILANAYTYDVVGLSLLEDPRLGTLWEQYADGLRGDGAHLTARGNVQLARLWIERLADAAIDPCGPVDINGDGALNLFDYLAFQTLFSNEDPAADLNQDGTFNLFDFLTFQTWFGNCA